jgi:hypothetical protein
VLSLIYVSVALVPAEAQEEVDALVDAAVRYNLSVGITGALVLAGGRFAQVLEGPDAEVRALMGRIAVDSRHRDVRIVRSAYQSERRFPHWGMTQIASSDEFGRLCAAAAACPERPVEAANALLALMEQCASARM